MWDFSVLNSQQTTSLRNMNRFYDQVSPSNEKNQRGVSALSFLSIFHFNGYMIYFVGISNNP